MTKAKPTGVVGPVTRADRPIGRRYTVKQRIVRFLRRLWP